MYALEVSGLKKKYANGLEALKGVDFKIKSGDFFALLGMNGAGKSTIIGLISTLVSKTSGSIAVNGYDIDQNTEQAKLNLGLVPQEINLNVFETCEQILLTVAGYYGMSRKSALPRAETLLKELSLWDKRFAKVRHLSGGMKRRLMIARALMHHPKVLLLDEPTAGVDVEIRRSVWDFLSKLNAEGTTIILTTHYLEEAEQLCKNVAIIDQGVIIKNTSMQSLLHSLHHQTFVFTTNIPLDKLPSLEPFMATKVDEHTFELRIDNQYTLNQVFALFDQHGIDILSVRSKANRLEELFMDLVKK